MDKAPKAAKYFIQVGIYCTGISLIVDFVSNNDFCKKAMLSFCLLTVSPSEVVRTN